jgi:hypothetical protein
MVLILGILLANIVTLWIDDFMLTFKWNYAPHIFTWIGMAIVVGIYYPLFTKIDKWSTKMGDQFMRVGKKIVGREIGAIFAFLIALILLYVMYGFAWYDTNVISSFLKSL